MAAADALGWQDQPGKIAATPQCTYNVASVSKIYCTAAVMILVQRGLVELDTPVVQYADFKCSMKIIKITVRHLLNHASGLPGTQWKGFWR
ncbi:MAG: serine hydrolase [Merdibacter sp.]